MNIHLYHGKVPDWLYERMPWVYLAGGCAVIAVFPTIYGQVSGGLLICAGALAALMRRTHRARQMADLLGRLSTPRRPGSRQAAWRQCRDRLTLPATGHPEQERHHQRLAGRLADLETARHLGDRREVIEELLQQLAEDLAEHLTWEVGTHRQAGRPLSPDWQQAQQRLLHSVQRLAADVVAPAHERARAAHRLVCEQHLGAEHPALPALEEALQAMRRPHGNPGGA